VDSNVSWHPDGTFKHTRCFIRDDSERRLKELAREMELRASKESSAAKSKFISRLFHEIRTPMHIVDASLQEVALALTLPNNSFSSTLPDDVAMQAGKDLRNMRMHVDTIMSSLEDVSIATMFEDGKALRMTPKPLSLSTVVRDIVDSIAPTEVRSGQMVQYSVLTSTVPAQVQVDYHIRRILGHLVRNAVRFSPDDAHITISISHVPIEGSTGGMGKFSFCVSNNVSRPVDLRIINDCFRRFYATGSLSSSKVQSDESLSSTLVSSQGVGLGLFVAFQLVESMGGQLSCDSVNNEAVFSFDLDLDLVPEEELQSQSYSHGASSKKRLIGTDDGSIAVADVWVGVSESDAAAKQIITSTSTSGSSKRAFSELKIPDSQAAGSESQSSCVSSSSSVDSVPSSTTDSTKARPLRVLVVDDSPMCQRVLVRALTNNGFLTDTADNGQTACDKLLVEPCMYDCVLMDLRMPIMDGISATKRCREAFHLNKIPIIVVTADISEESKEEALLAGANDVLGKPAKSDDVMDTIRKYLNL
jgi:CheY-like chemotaxis protein